MAIFRSFKIWFNFLSCDDINENWLRYALFNIHLLDNFLSMLLCDPCCCQLSPFGMWANVAAQEKHKLEIGIKRQQKKKSRAPIIPLTWARHGSGIMVIKYIIQMKGSVLWSVIIDKENRNWDRAIMLKSVFCALSFFLSNKQTKKKLIAK